MFDSSASHDPSFVPRAMGMMPNGSGQADSIPFHDCDRDLVDRDRLLRGGTSPNPRSLIERELEYRDTILRARSTISERSVVERDLETLDRKLRDPRRALDAQLKERDLALRGTTAARRAIDEALSEMDDRLRAGLSIEKREVDEEGRDHAALDRQLRTVGHAAAKRQLEEEGRDHVEMDRHLRASGAAAKRALEEEGRDHVEMDRHLCAAGLAKRAEHAEEGRDHAAMDKHLRAPIKRELVRDEGAMNERLRAADHRALDDEGRDHEQDRQLRAGKKAPKRDLVEEEGHRDFAAVDRTLRVEPNKHEMDDLAARDKKLRGAIHDAHKIKREIGADLQDLDGHLREEGCDHAALDRQLRAAEIGRAHV